MHINIVTLFPEWFGSPLKMGLLGRARESGLVEFELADPRTETHDPHRTVDDRPYGGGPGMVLLLEPLVASLRRISGGLGRTLMLSASGRPFTQALARELSGEPRLTLICGRYEGIDDRLREIIPLEPVSVGEAVLNGGEVGAMMVIEAVTRLIPGFMGRVESGDDESFSDGLLEYPHYTRPEVFEGVTVPEVLRNGNHAGIAAWRRAKSLETTLERRPDMLSEAPLSVWDIKALRSRLLDVPCLGRRLHLAFVQAPVILGWKKVGAMALTKSDIEDIAHCSHVYAVASIHVVAPQAGQRDAGSPFGVWDWKRSDSEGSFCGWEESLADAIDSVRGMCGETPLVVYANAPMGKGEMTTIVALRKSLRDCHVLLVFGMGFGLAPDALGHVDRVLRPIRVLRGDNHLSVRSVAQILTDRLLGDVY